MALITCPECGQSVSDKAKTCIHCGCPILDSSEPMTSVAKDVVENSIYPYELLSEKTAVELINYIQFSVAKVINSKSKGLLEDEFDAVINNINPSSLQDMELINAYEDLLKALTMLKLNENQREQAKKIMLRKKKNAITQSLNSFGSIFVPGSNPFAIFAAAAYTGGSAVFNYKRALNEAEIESEESEFEINQSDLEVVDELRSTLFISSAKVFSNKSNTVQGLISENEMKQFADCVNKLSNNNPDKTQSVVVLLESAEDTLKLFPPYWVAMAVGYKQLGIKDKCFDALDVFDKLMENNPIFKKNPYVLKSARVRVSNIIENLSGKELSAEEKKILEKCICVIKSNTPSLQQETDSLNYDLAQLYGMIGNFDEAKKSIQYLVARNLIKKNSRLEIQLKFLQEGGVKDSKTVSLLENIFSSITFGLTEEISTLIHAYKVSDFVDLKNNVIIHVSSQNTVCNVELSKDGVLYGLSPMLIRHRLSAENRDDGVIIETQGFSWNDMAENPFVRIETDMFTACFKASIVEPSELWPYSQTINLKNKISRNLSLLDDSKTVSQFKSFSKKGVVKLGAKFAAGEVLGVVSGIASAESLKDISKIWNKAKKDVSKAWQDTKKADLTWLVITLVSVKGKNSEEINLFDNNNRPLLEDFRGEKWHIIAKLVGSRFRI